MNKTIFHNRRQDRLNEIMHGSKLNVFVIYSSWVLFCWRQGVVLEVGGGLMRVDGIYFMTIMIILYLFLMCNMKLVYSDCFNCLLLIEELFYLLNERINAWNGRSFDIAPKMSLMIIKIFNYSFNLVNLQTPILTLKSLDFFKIAFIFHLCCLNLKYKLRFVLFIDKWQHLHVFVNMKLSKFNW